jgi:hypothetical protein
MRNFQKVGQNDIIPLLTSIKRQPDLWREDSYLRDYPQGPFGEVETIMLRFPEKRVFEQEEEIEKYKRGESQFDQHESIFYPAWHKLPEAHSMVFGLMAYMKAIRLGRVMINKIKPGGVIFPHRDTLEHASYWDRFHVVLQSGPGCNFRCDDEVVNMGTGEVWWFQNLNEHEVQNNSSVDRIHMILDLRLS